MILLWILPDPDTISIPIPSWSCSYFESISFMILLLSRFHLCHDPASISVLFEPRSCFFHGSLPTVILFVSRILLDPDHISILVSSQFYSASIQAPFYHSYQIHPGSDLMLLQTSFFKIQRKLYLIFEKL